MTLIPHYNSGPMVKLPYLTNEVAWLSPFAGANRMNFLSKRSFAPFAHQIHVHMKWCGDLRHLVGYERERVNNIYSIPFKNTTPLSVHLATFSLSAHLGTTYSIVVHIFSTFPTNEC